MKKISKISLQKGLTLVELLIASTLSLIIMLFISNIMLTSGRTALQSEGLAQAQENGRFILSWLQENVRMAGMPYPSDKVRNRVQPFADVCAATTLPPAANADCSLDQTNSANSDRLAVQRTFTNDIVYGTNQSRSDCTGVEITTLSDGDLVVDLYWVETNNNNTGGVLKCVTYNAETHQPLHAVQEIANGIEGMQVLYGVRSGAEAMFRSNVNRYVSLADLSSNDLENNIGAVRISILTRAFTERSAETRARRYILLDAAPVTFNDAVTRHIQTTTIFLPNE